MRNNIKNWANKISYLFLFLIIVLLIIYYKKDILTTFDGTKWWLIFLLSFLHIPIIASGGLAFEILCTEFKINLKWQDWLGLSFIANFLNQLLPYRPGMGFRYIYLTKRYHMKSSVFFTIMFIYFLLMLMVSSLFTLLGWLLSDLPIDFNLITLFAFFILLSMSAFILWIKLRKSRFHPFQKLSECCSLLFHHPLILVSSLFTFVFANSLTALIFYIIFIAVGFPIPFTDCLFLTGVSTLVMIFPITPGNIGLLETFIGTLTQMMFDQFGLGFSVIALFRISQWIPSLVLGTAFSLLLAGSFLPKLQTSSKKD